jgi:hypothetical protein
VFTGAEARWAMSVVYATLAIALLAGHARLVPARLAAVPAVGADHTVLSVPAERPVR